MLLYNTLTRKKELFEPLNAGEVKIYACGPTVYDFAHIGNFRAFIFDDIVHRYFLFKGYKVTMVQNLTDVDDKTINGSKKENIPLAQYTEKYANAFFEDLEKLNILKADTYPKATGHISEMVALTKRLMGRGIAYKGEDGSIYYKIDKFPEYGKLSRFKLKQLKVGASGRVAADQYTKEQVSDFALWKAWTAEDGAVFWETEIGKGRPGWHLECSAMSTKYLGETFDIHCGGIDLMFPHHENEIAQSEGASGKQFVRFWLHNEHILVEGKKMSKSLGNFYTLRDVLGKGYKPEAIRYLFLSAHYRDQMNFSFKALESAQAAVDRVFDFVRSVKAVTSDLENPDVKNVVSDFGEQFELAMDDDLNTPLALSVLFDFIKTINSYIAENNFGINNAKEALMAIEKADKVLGLLRYMEKPLPLPKEELDRMIQEREAARKAGDFKKSDEIRKQLKEKGIVLEDSKGGVVWKVV